MVGRDVEGPRREERAGGYGEVVLALEGLSAPGDRGGDAVRGVSLELRAGEILAIAGVAGNGQRELAEAITGTRPLSNGSVAVAGKRLRTGDPRAAIRAGIAHVPEDRLHTAVAPSLSIASNVSLKSYGGDGSFGPFLRLRRFRERARELIGRYDVKAPGPETPARLLSGGNLQKVVLGREFSGDPKVLVAASPTRGLDVGAIETVHRVPARGSGGGRRRPPALRGPRRGARARRPDRGRRTRARSSASSTPSARPSRRSAC